jgi:hypothetical protein
MVINLRKLFFFITAFTFFFSSCTLQKRLYNKGFYVDTHHYSLNKHHEKAYTDTLPSLLTTIIKPLKAKVVPATISADIQNKTIENKYSKFNTIKLIDACDTLFLKNGAKILCKVTEINTSKIIFSSCDQTASSITKKSSSFNKSEVSYIVFSNGLKEVVETLPGSNYQQTEKTNGFAIAGFVLSIVDIPLFLLFGLLALVASIGGVTMYTGVFLAIPLFLALLAIVFCIAAIVQINRNKNYETGEALAIVGLVLSIILSVILIAILVAIL